MLRQVKLSACEKFCRKNTPSAIRQKFENFEKKRKDPRESPDVVLQKHNERRDRFTKYCEASQMTENDVSNFDTADDLTKPDTPATSLQQEEEERKRREEEERLRKKNLIKDKLVSGISCKKHCRRGKPHLTTICLIEHSTQGLVVSEYVGLDCRFSGTEREVCSARSSRIFR